LIDWANGLNFADHTDWRLPKINELKSFQEVTWGHYQNQPTDNYWSSTTTADVSSDALVIRFWYGGIVWSSKSVASSHAVAVRGGE